MRRGRRTNPGVRGILSIGIALACVLPTLSAPPAAADTPEAINVQGALCGAVQGTPVAGTIATFTDTDTSVAAATLRARIDWGDGAVTNGTLTGAGGTFAVSGTHTYASAASLIPVSVIAWNNVTAVSGAVQFWFDVAAPASGSGEGLVVTGGKICGATEGSPVSGTVGAFTDTDHTLAASAFLATIQWGDGTPATIGTISGANGVFTIDASHLYLEEFPFDPVAVTITVSHVGTAVAGSAYVSFLVSEGDMLTGSPVSFDASPGVAFSGTVATFADQNVNVIVPEFSATIDWGDGSAPTAGVVSAGESPGRMLVAGSHTYAAPGTFDVLVEIDDSSPGTASATVDSTANVAERVAVHGVLGGATEGTPVGGVIATFTDPLPGLVPANFAATIDWGDGNAGTGTITGANGSFSVSGSHTYTDEALSVSVVVSVRHIQTSAAGSATMTFPVADADVLTGSPVAIGATAGTAFSGTVATFSDAYTGSNASDFAATIDWGDGGAPVAGSVSAAGPGAFAVAGTHTYAAPGAFSVTVHLAEKAPGSAAAGVVSAATVAPDPPAPPPAPPAKGLADVRVGLVGPASVAPGAPLTYTLTVTNAGPSTATDVGVGFVMPWGASFVSASPQATLRCRNSLAWPRVTLASGASVTYVIVLTAPTRGWDGRLFALAGASSRVRDPNPWNNVGAVRTTVTGSGWHGHHGHHHDDASR